MMCYIRTKLELNFANQNKHILVLNLLFSDRLLTMGRGKHASSKPKTTDNVACKICYDRYVNIMGHWDGQQQQSFTFTTNTGTKISISKFIVMHKNLGTHNSILKNKGDDDHSQELSYYTMNPITKLPNHPQLSNIKSYKQGTLDMFATKSTKSTTKAANNNNTSKRDRSDNDNTILPPAKRQRIKAPNNTKCKQLMLKKAFEMQRNLFKQQLVNEKPEFVEYSTSMDKIKTKHSNGIKLDEIESRLLTIELSKQKLIVKTIDDIRYKFFDSGINTIDIKLTKESDISDCYNNQLFRFEKDISKVLNEDGSLNVTMYYCMHCIDRKQPQPTGAPSFKNGKAIHALFMKDKYNKGIIIRDINGHFETFMHDSNTRKTKQQKLHKIMEKQYSIAFDIVETNQSLTSYTSQCAREAKRPVNKGKNIIGTSGHSITTLYLFLQNMKKVVTFLKFSH